MIAQLMQQEDISELTDECDRFCKYVNHVMGAKVTVGIGTVVRMYTRAGELLSECEGGSILQGALWQQQGNKHDRG